MPNTQSDKSFKKNRQHHDKQVEALRVPPHSLEAEQSVIGGLLLDNQMWDRVSELVVAQDFYSRSHRVIFEGIAELIEKGNPVDLVTLSEFLEKQNKLDDALEIATKIDDKKSIGLIYSKKAKLQLIIEDLDDAITSINKAIEVQRLTKDNENLGNSYKIFGDIYASKENFKEARA